MAFLRLSVSAAALLALGTASAQAQSTHARVIIAPHGQPRIAGIAPAPAQQQAPTASNGPTVFATYPIVMMPDGQVLVDLGNGYQEVARACPYAYGYGCDNQPSDNQPTVFQPYVPPLAPAYDGPRYTPRREEPAYAPPPRPSGVYVKSGPVATPRGYAAPPSVAPRRTVVHR